MLNFRDICQFRQFFSQSAAFSGFSVVLFPIHQNSRRDVKSTCKRGYFITSHILDIA